MWVHGPAGSGKSTLVEDMARTPDHDYGGPRITLRVPGVDFGSVNWRMSLGADLAEIQANAEKQLVVDDIAPPNDEAENEAALELLVSLASGAEIEMDARHRQPQRVRFSRIFVISQASPEQVFPCASALKRTMREIRLVARQQRGQLAESSVLV